MTPQPRNYWHGSLSFDSLPRRLNWGSRKKKKEKKRDYLFIKPHRFTFITSILLVAAILRFLKKKKKLWRMSWQHCRDFICQHGKCVIKWGCGYFTGQQGEITEAARLKKKTEKKQDADSLMRPFHNMSMWQGQDVVHSLGLKIKTAPLDAHT